MKITKDARDQILLDMRGLVNDFAKENKFPSDEDFKERLGIERTSIFKYKKIIIEEDRKSLLEIFGTERIKNVEDTIKIMKENIKINKEIRDDKDCTKHERMQAAENMERSHLSMAQIMYDAPEYLYQDDSKDDVKDDNINNDSKQEHPDRSKETESEQIKSTTD